jgi:flagellar hook-length control protein FliK
MKVPPKKNAPPDDGRLEARRGAGRAGKSGGARGRTQPNRPDFATVLERVSREREAGEKKGKGVSPPQEYAAAPEPEPAADGVRRRREGNEEEAGRHVAVGSDSRAGLRPAAPPPEAPQARPALRTADLEKMVEAIRVQVTASGQRQLSIDFSRTVLEGLRVRLRTDGAGRLSAEFVVANEQIRSLIQSRSHELAGMLLDRGIELSSLRTSIEADSSDRDEPEGGRGSLTRAELRRRALGAHDASDSEPVEKLDGDDDRPDPARSATKHRA